MEQPNRVKPGPKLGPSWVQAGPKPDFWKFGNLGPGHLEIWDPKKKEILKIKIRSAQNVGKVWISRKKIILAQFGVISGHFVHGPKQIKKYKKCVFSLVGPCCYPPGVGE